METQKRSLWCARTDSVWAAMIVTQLLLWGAFYLINEQAQRNKDLERNLRNSVECAREELQRELTLISNQVQFLQAQRVPHGSGPKAAANENPGENSPVIIAPHGSLPSQESACATNLLVSEELTRSLGTVHLSNQTKAPK